MITNGLPSATPVRVPNPDHPGATNPSADASEPAATTVSPDFIDVSHREGDVDWAGYAAAGKKLAVIKLTEGGDWNDPKAAENRAGAAKAGLELGLYHYAGASVGHTMNDPAVEASHYLEQVGTLGKNEFPVLDFEDADGKTPAQLVDWANKFCSTVEEKTGKTPWLYTYSGFLHKELEDGKDLAHYPLWLADYSSGDDRQKPPTAIAPWPNLVAWQYSSATKVDGVKTPVDGSFLYGKEP